MQRLMLSIGAAAAAVPLALGQPAFAQEREAGPYYGGETRYTQCRQSSGTTGLAIGGIAGALLGAGIIGGGLIGPLLGGAGGAFAGRTLDRNSSKDCRVARTEERYEAPRYEQPRYDGQRDSVNGDLYQDRELAPVYP